MAYSLITFKILFHEHSSHLGCITAELYFNLLKCSISCLGRFHAFVIAHSLDRNSNGRGVRQLKTTLLQRLEQVVNETEFTCSYIWALQVATCIMLASFSSPKMSDFCYIPSLPTCGIFFVFSYFQFYIEMIEHEVILLLLWKLDLMF